MDFASAFDAVKAIPDLKTKVWKTPGAGNTSKPFRVERATDDLLEVRTSQGGRVSLRAFAFDAGVKALDDLGAADATGERWVLVSDEALQAVLASENRDRAVSSYVLPLLEGAGLIELARERP